MVDARQIRFCLVDGAVNKSDVIGGVGINFRLPHDFAVEQDFSVEYCGNFDVASARVEAYPCTFIVLSGGNPFVFRFGKFVDAFHNKGFSVNLFEKTDVEISRAAFFIGRSNSVEKRFIAFYRYFISAGNPQCGF